MPAVLTHMPLAIFAAGSAKADVATRADRDRARVANAREQVIGISRDKGSNASWTTHDRALFPSTPRAAGRRAVRSADRQQLCCGLVVGLGGGERLHLRLELARGR